MIIPNFVPILKKKQQCNKKWKFKVNKTNLLFFLIHVFFPQVLSVLYLNYADVSAFQINKVPCLPKVMGHLNSLLHMSQIWTNLFYYLLTVS